MQLYPTRATFQVAIAAAAMVTAGVLFKMAPAVAFGGAMLLAVVLGRALAMSTVGRIRASGFEMVWTTAHRVTRGATGSELILEGELRNRGDGDARGVNIRPVASSMLEVSVKPESLDLLARSKVRFELRIRGKRVGRWGVHGIALEVRGTPLGGEGLYEVPLMFANPHGIEIVPHPLHAMLQSARGGRARHVADVGRAAPVKGESEHLKELREHVAGDPFKRIAWKASARRGKLLVREMDQEERDVVWLVLDASVELWAGSPGAAPMDLAIEELAGLAARHLARGNRTGLVVYASRMRSWIVPDKESGQLSKIAAALASAASTVDSDRCELEEAELAQRVAEHLRPLDPRGLTDLPRRDFEALSLRAEAMRSRAPFAPRLPLAASAREQRLRIYLASFGIETPPRAAGERERSAAQLPLVLEKILAEKAKTKPSIVHVWAPAPKLESATGAVLRKLRAKHVEVRWTMPSFEPSLARTSRIAGTPQVVEQIVFEAVRKRVRASQARAERLLRVAGIMNQRLRRTEKEERK